MRTYTLVFVALATVLLYTEYVVFGYIQICHEDNCVTPESCEIQRIGPCSQGLVCCSVVKSEYKTHCVHHGGDCMDYCDSNLQSHAGICPKNKICCVMVKN